MNSMQLVTARSLLFIPLAAVFFFAACGGGGDDGAGTGSRVTDPAKVQTSTPITNAVLFTVLQDGSISAAGLPDPATPRAGTPVNGGTTTTGTAKTHKVTSGESCAAIAELYGISSDDLLKANRFIDASCGNLKIDDELKIPSAATPGVTPRPGTTTTPGGGGNTYTVAAGDSCSSIATSKGITVPTLISLNPTINADCTNLKIGQVVKLQ